MWVCAVFGARCACETWANSFAGSKINFQKKTCKPRGARSQHAGKVPHVLKGKVCDNVSSLNQCHSTSTLLLASHPQAPPLSLYSLTIANTFFNFVYGANQCHPSEFSVMTGALIGVPLALRTVLPLPAESRSAYGGKPLAAPPLITAPPPIMLP